jgi:hypothetical protein
MFRSRSLERIFHDGCFLGRTIGPKIAMISLVVNKSREPLTKGVLAFPER